jgi:hypothetical protein
VIVGVQTLVCAYAKLKLGRHHKKIDSNKYFGNDLEIRFFDKIARRRTDV